MSKYFLHYIGSKLYPKEIFIKEAETLGVNRCLPLHMIKKLKWGDKILIATFISKELPIGKEYCPKCKTELEHITTFDNKQDIHINQEDVFGCSQCKKEVPRNKSIKEKLDGRKNKKDGIAKVFGFFNIVGLNINASDEFKKELTGQLDIVESKDINTKVNRRCGSYTLGTSHIVKNSIEDIVSKAQKLSVEKQEKVKFFIAGGFYPLDLTIQPINFSRTIIEVDIENELNLSSTFPQTVSYILDYNKRAYIKKYAKRGRPRKNETKME